MDIVGALIDELRTRYNGDFSFVNICVDENIIVFEIHLSNTFKSMFFFYQRNKVILINGCLSWQEQQYQGWLELFFHFHPPANNGRDEDAAERFANLCMQRK